jgi:hypothetical protein
VRAGLAKTHCLNPAGQVLRVWDRALLLDQPSHVVRQGVVGDGHIRVAHVPVRRVGPALPDVPPRRVHRHRVVPALRFEIGGNFWCLSATLLKKSTV